MSSAATTKHCQLAPVERWVLLATTGLLFVLAMRPTLPDFVSMFGDGEALWRHRFEVRTYILILIPLRVLSTLGLPILVVVGLPRGGPNRTLFLTFLATAIGSHLILPGDELWLVLIGYVALAFYFVPRCMKRTESKPP